MVKTLFRAMWQALNSCHKVFVLFSQTLDSFFASKAVAQLVEHHMPSQAAVLVTFLLSEDHHSSAEGTAEALNTGGCELCLEGASRSGATLRT